MEQPPLFSPTKICTLCGVNPTSGRGPCQTCIDTGNALKESYRVKKRKRRTNRVPDETKTCSLCGITTNILNFHIANKGARSTRCIDCANGLKNIKSEELKYWQDKLWEAETIEEQRECQIEIGHINSLKSAVFTRYAIEQCFGISDGSLAEKYVQWCML